MHWVAVSLHTLSLICNTMQDPRQCWMYLCILVHCKECRHTERSRSSQGVPVVPSLPRYPGDLVGHECQWSQKDPGVLFATRLVALSKRTQKVSTAESVSGTWRKELLTLCVNLHWERPVPQGYRGVIKKKNLSTAQLKSLTRGKKKVWGCAELPPPTPSV